MLPAYIIHHKSCIDRKDIVIDLLQKTRGKVVDAVWCQDGKEGCRNSHLKVAALAKEEHPDSPYLVFEDDCILTDCWKEIVDRCISPPEKCDLAFLGFNDICDHSIFGTHAMLIFPKARDSILKYTEYYADKVKNTGAYDWILSRIIVHYNLSYKMPCKANRFKYAYQKPSLKSYITGKIR